MTVEERQKVLDDHLEAYGDFQPAAFLEEAADDDHPAHGWFTWDDSTAANAYRMQQSRDFVSGLRCERVQDVTEAGPIRYVTMPVVVTEGRGVYVSTETPKGRTLLAVEAAQRLKEWWERYGSILEPPARKLHALMREVDRAVEKDSAEERPEESEGARAGESASAAPA